ncbi:hypothetical protein [Listeria booriae]|uniref:Uncharacterized protein n=1 Tax=Listeria booriae TaxID=1552123 RepID=A0A842EVZ7_9LIST|nr:hypothetical protein [Listeria booriae]MBC2242247.1 hypothetical protein [Listeria booriae]
MINKPADQPCSKIERTQKLEATLTMFEDGRTDLEVDAKGEPAVLLCIGLGILDQLIEEIAGDNIGLKKELMTISMDHFRECLEVIKKEASINEQT